MRKYYLGIEAARDVGAFNLYGQLGYTSTLDSDYSNDPDEGTDFRQIRDGFFLSVAGDYALSPDLVLTGQIAGMTGKSSTDNDAIDEVSFQGLALEAAGEYQFDSSPFTFRGGVGLATGQFTDGDEDEHSQELYAFLGVRYWFGAAGGSSSLADKRRGLAPFEKPDYLAVFENMAAGNLN